MEICTKFCVGVIFVYHKVNRVILLMVIVMTLDVLDLHS